MWRPGVILQPPCVGRQMVQSSTGMYLCWGDTNIFLQNEKRNEPRQCSIFKGNYNFTCYFHSRNKRGLIGFFKPIDFWCNGLNLTGIWPTCVKLPQHLTVEFLTIRNQLTGEALGLLDTLQGFLKLQSLCSFINLNVRAFPQAPQVISVCGMPEHISHPFGTLFFSPVH